MSSEELVPGWAGPVPDRLTIWPVDDGRYGLDATFQRARQHQAELERAGVQHAFRQELDGSWTLRFGPLQASDVARALAAVAFDRECLAGKRPPPRDLQHERDPVDQRARDSVRRKNQLTQLSQIPR